MGIVTSTYHFCVVAPGHSFYGTYTLDSVTHDHTRGIGWEYLNPIIMLRPQSSKSQLGINSSTYILDSDTHNPTRDAVGISVYLTHQHCGFRT